MSKGLLEDLVDLALEFAVVLDSALALLGLLPGQGFGRAFALQEASPAVINTVELRRVGFAGTVRLATSAGGPGEAAGQQGQLNFKG